MRKTLLIILVFINLVAFGQKKIFPEQIAFDYFESELLKEHFDSESKFILNKKIREYSSHYFPKCENDSLDDNYLYIATNNIYPAPTDSAVQAQRELVIRKDSILFDCKIHEQFIEKRKSAKRKNVKKVSIIENISVIPNFYLVTISVATEEIETNFFIEIDRNGNVTRWCSGKWWY